MATPGCSLRAPPSGEPAEGHDKTEASGAPTGKVASRSLDWPAPSQCGAVMVRPLAGWSLQVELHPRSVVNSHGRSGTAKRWHTVDRRFGPQLCPCCSDLAALGRGSPRRHSGNRQHESHAWLPWHTFMYCALGQRSSTLEPRRSRAAQAPVDLGVPCNFRNSSHRCSATGTQISTQQACIFLKVPPK